MFVQNSFKGEPLQLPEEHSRRWSLPCKNVSVAETRIQSARFQPHSQHYRLGTAVLLLSTCPSLWGSREPCPQGVSPRHPSIAAGSACMLVGHVAPGEPPPQQSPEACRTQAAPRRHLLSRAVCGSFPSDPTPWGCLPFVAKTQPHFAINTTLTRGEYSSRKGILSPSSCPPLVFPPCSFPIA